MTTELLLFGLLGVLFPALTLPMLGLVFLFGLQQLHGERRRELKGFALIIVAGVVLL